MTHRDFLLQNWETIFYDQEGRWYKLVATARGSKDPLDIEALLYETSEDHPEAIEGTENIRIMLGLKKNNDKYYIAPNDEELPEVAKMKLQTVCVI